MINITQSIILGIIEGFTEFLPISSTAHLILYNYFTGIDITNASVKVFEISIQFGAILAVIFYYFKDLIKIQNIKLLLISVIPTLALGLILKDHVSILQEMPKLIAVNLIVGGLLILITEYFYKKRTIGNKDSQDISSKTIKNKIERVKNINYLQGLALGLVQSLAMMPGVSRSGAVIVYGLYKNYDREVIAKFTFLLAVPTMIAATAYSLLKNYKLILSNGAWSSILIGIVTSFFVAMIVVRYALPFIKKYSFVPFGYYRILIGLIILVSLIK